MKKVLIFLVLVGAAVAAVLVYRNQHPPATNRILVSGNIELTQVDIAFKTAGRLVELNVGEGDPVNNDMVVARLDRDQLDRQREAQSAALRTAEVQLEQARSSLEWQRQTLAADLDMRQSQINSAESKVKDLNNGPRPEEIEQARAAVDATQAEDDRSRRDWDRAQNLYRDDDISTSQYDQYRTRFQNAEANLKQAKERLALLYAGPRTEEVAGANAQLSGAHASMKMGQANQLELKRREQEVMARESEIERARAQIGLLDSQIRDTIAKSPIQGVVLVKSANVGEVLAPGTTVISVGDIDHPWLRAYVGESDLGRVKLGSKVRVTTDSFPGKIYEGHVSFISPQAEFTPKEIQTTEERVKLVFSIKIEIDNPQREVKSNMPADAEILVN